MALGFLPGGYLGHGINWESILEMSERQGLNYQ